MLNEKTYTIEDDWTLTLQDLTEDKKVIGEIAFTKEEAQKLLKFLNDFYVKF